MTRAVASRVAVGVVAMGIVGSASLSTSPSTAATLREGFTSPAGTTSCRYVDDGRGSQGRGTLMCVNRSSNLFVQWRTNRLPKVRTATADLYRKFENLPTLPYLALMAGVGPKRKWAGRGMRLFAYYCSTSVQYGTSCLKWPTDGGPEMRFRSGVLTVVERDGQGGTVWTWTNDGWRSRYYPDR